MRDDVLKRNLEAARWMARKSYRKTWGVQAELSAREMERRASQAG
jgi:hypothetical protein